MQSLLGTVRKKSNGNQRQEKRDALKKRERQYYTDHPKSTLRLTPTGGITQYGMPIYTDQHGWSHSESSETFQLPNNKWTTAPVIWPDPETGEGRYFKRKELIEILGSNGWRNPITGEKLPMFDSEPEASSWALDRDMTLQ